MFRAASAGFFLLEAGDIAAMAPGTNTGAAHPVMFGGEMDAEMKRKVENDAAAYLRSICSKRGEKETTSCTPLLPPMHRATLMSVMKILTNKH